MTAVKTYNPDHDNNFDLIRLLAASQVMYSHTIEHLKLPYPEGMLLWLTFSFPGVPVFFLISGFLVTQSFYSCGERPAAFLSRRVTRIYPALFVNLLVLALLLFFCGNLYPGFWEGLLVVPWLAVSSLMGSDYFGNLLVGTPFHWQGLMKAFPSGVLWSISAELGFYLLVPIAFSRALRERGLLLVSVLFWGVTSFLIALTLSLYRAEIPPTLLATLSCSPFPYFWIFLIGAGLQRVWPQIRPFIAGWGFIWLPLYVGAAYLSMKYVNKSVLDYENPDVTVVIRLVLLGCALLSVAYTFPKLGRILGGMDLSYGIYLWHMPWIRLLILWGLAPAVWGWAVVVGGAAGIAALSWFIIEKPAMARKSEVGRAFVRFADAVQARIAHLVGRLPLRLPTTATRFLAPGLVFSVAAYLAVAGLGLHILTSARARVVEGVTRGPAVFIVSPLSGKQNWDVVGGAKASSDNSVITLTGEATQWSTQFQSIEIPALRRGDFILEYDIETTNGHMGIGILDARPNGPWLTTLPRITQKTGAIRFQAHGIPLRVSLFNSNVTPTNTVAKIHKLTLYSVP